MTLCFGFCFCFGFFLFPCQFVNTLLFLSEKLAMPLLHQQFLQVQSTDSNCKGLVGNETVGCCSVIQKRG